MNLSDLFAKVARCHGISEESIRRRQEAAQMLAPGNDEIKPGHEIEVAMVISRLLFEVEVNPRFKAAVESKLKDITKELSDNN